jgi:PTH2 family peptidyl-tRNA hydrolase
LIIKKKFDIKQVILVRADLKMPKGKLAVQVAHASVDAVLSSRKKLVKLWKSEGMKKICLKVKDLAELNSYVNQAQIEGLNTAVIRDAGKTVFKEPTITCAAIGPENSEKVDKVTKELKML